MIVVRGSANAISGDFRHSSSERPRQSSSLRSCLSGSTTQRVNCGSPKGRHMTSSRARVSPRRSIVAVLLPLAALGEIYGHLRLHHSGPHPHRAALPVPIQAGPHASRSRLPDHALAGDARGHDARGGSPRRPDSARAVGWGRIARRGARARVTDDIAFFRGRSKHRRSRSICRAVGISITANLMRTREALRSRRRRIE